ncbi:MAG: hypothetical protein ABI662_11820 [Dermatophilaceae bacterium]
MKWRGEEVGAVLFVGDDWAEDHHDVELVDEDGKVVAKRRGFGVTPRGSASPVGRTLDD